MAGNTSVADAESALREASALSEEASRILRLQLFEIALAAEMIAFQGKTFAFTGAFRAKSRLMWKAAVQIRGAKVDDKGPGYKTDVLVVGDGMPVNLHFDQANNKIAYAWLMYASGKGTLRICFECDLAKALAKDASS